MCGDGGQAPAAQQIVGPCDWQSMSKPSRAPMPCTTMCSGRLAVTRGSFCRSEPAAALRGLANGLSPASDQPGVELLELLHGEEDLAADLHQRPGRPFPVSRSGMSAMVRTLGVMSSPVRPSPRVAARVSLPCS